MISAIIISVVAVIAVICIITGLVKGYSNSKSWGAEYFLTAVITVAVYRIADFENDILDMALAFGTAVVLLLLFAFISTMIRSSFKHKIADARLYSYYKTYGDREQNLLEIRDAIELGDKKLYKKLTKRKMKEKSGAAGVWDRLFGMVNMLIQGVVICAIAAVLVLLVLQFTQLPFVLEGGALYTVYESHAWQYITPYILDFLVILILQATIRAGYRSGVLNAVFVLIVIVLVGAAGYVAYWLAFNVETFISLAESTGYKTIAQVAITVVIFIVEFIIIMILSVVVSKAISSAREAKAVSAIDGVFGAIVYTAIALAVLMLAGMLLYSFNGLEFMDIFNSYCFVEVDGETQSTVLFSYLYNKNPLNDIEVFSNLQSTIAGYFSN